MKRRSFLGLMFGAVAAKVSAPLTALLPKSADDDFISVVGSYNPTVNATMSRIDVLYGFAPINSAMACRITNIAEPTWFEKPTRTRFDPARLPA